MAAQRVPVYLKKHKIGALFESLMAKVIQDTPDDPIGYIITILQGIQKKQLKKLENSFNGQSSSRPPSRHSAQGKVGNERRTNHLAASWSAGGTKQQKPKTDESEVRTWTANDLKSVQNQTWSSGDPKDEPGSSQPAWNNDTRVPTHDFDELFQMQHGGGDPRVDSKQQQPLLEKYSGVRSWDAVEKKSVDQKITFEPSDNDELSSELLLGKSSASHNTDTRTFSGSRSVKTSRRTEHRKQLQALLLEESSGVDERKTIDVRSYSPEEGNVILERAEDLQQEGVSSRSVASQGAKLKKSQREERDVSVTICARCARIIGDKDEVLSQASSGDFSARMFDDITRKEDLKNIDSASEASEILNPKGKNGWIMTDSEDESTPRNIRMTSKDKTFDSFSRSKESRHQHKSSGNNDYSSPEPTYRSSKSRSSNINHSSRGFSNMKRNAWRKNDKLSDNESETSDVMLQRGPSLPGSISGRAWRMSSGNNSDEDSILTTDY